MANSSKPDQETHNSNTGRTIRDIFISANLHNPLKIGNKPPSPQDTKTKEIELTLRWMVDLLRLPGTGYLTGATIGTVKGSVQGIRAVTGSTEPVFVRMNRVLDSGIEGGKRFGGPLGMVGLLYCALEIGTSITTKRRYPHPYDTVNTVVAGFGTGALYKVISGQKGAVFSGFVGALAAVAVKLVMVQRNKQENIVYHTKYER